MSRTSSARQAAAMLAAEALQSIATGLLVWSVLYLLFIQPFFVLKQLESAITLMTVLLVLAGSLGCLKRGRVRTASAVFLVGMGAALVPFMVLSGGIESPALGFGLAVGVTAAWLLGQRAAWIWTGAFLALTLALAIGTHNGVRVTKHLPSPPMVTWALLCGVAVIVILPLNRVLGTLHDALEKARTGEERYRLLFSTGADAVFVYAIEDGHPGCFLEVNDVACRRLGYTREELLGLRCTDITEKSASSPDLRSIPREKQTVWESVHIAKDGRRVPVEISLQLFEWNGRATAISSVRDISERMKLEEELRQSQKLESLGRLAGGIAHDFNNLLTIMDCHAELALADAGNEEVISNIEQIRRAGERAASLTKQLLAFSRKQVVQLKPVDLNAVVTECVEMFRRVSGAEIAFETRLDASLAEVIADRGQLHQVLLNLFVNARDAMPDGGLITVETTAAAGGAGLQAVLDVTDTGTGMTPEVQRRAFEPFFTTKPVGKGTGLGLSTAYGIVRQCGGTIDVRSAPGRGSTFRIQLPCGAPRAERTLAEHSAASGSTRTATILVAEDEREVRSLLVSILQKCGHKVLAAEDGQAALRLAQEHNGPIDLLVTDMLMPGLNGSELAAELKERRNGIRVLYISGYTGELPKGDGENVQLLAKPFTPAALEAKIREVLSE